MKIVVLDGYTLNPGDNPWDPLAALGDLTVYDRTAPELVLERSRGAEVLITNKVRLDAATLAALPDLRCIGVIATGYDVVDIVAAGERGIPVMNVVNYGTEAVAQHAFALLLELCRRTALHDAGIRSGGTGACLRDEGDRRLRPQVRRRFAGLRRAGRLSRGVRGTG